ncbi:MAG: type II toxin-antitoxin system HicB family antitoxin [Dehalococcoidia bacterium]
MKTEDGTQEARHAIVLGRDVVIEPELMGGYHAYCPSLRGCHSTGRTMREATENVAEAMTLWLQSARDLGLHPA